MNRDEIRYLDPATHARLLTEFTRRFRIEDDLPEKTESRIWHVSRMRPIYFQHYEDIPATADAGRIDEYTRDRMKWFGEDVTVWRKSP